MFVWQHPLRSTVSASRSPLALARRARAAQTHARRPAEAAPTLASRSSIDGGALLAVPSAFPAFVLPPVTARRALCGVRRHPCRYVADQWNHTNKGLARRGGPERGARRPRANGASLARLASAHSVRDGCFLKHRHGGACALAAPHEGPALAVLSASSASACCAQENQIFQLKFTSKQMARMAKKCEKQEEEVKGKVKKAMEKGDMGSARIYAQDAIRIKSTGTNYLRLSSRLDACASRVESAVKMQQVTKQMGMVTKGMDKVLKSMDVNQISKVMDQFEGATWARRPNALRVAPGCVHRTRARCARAQPDGSRARVRVPLMRSLVRRHASALRLYRGRHEFRDGVIDARGRGREPHAAGRRYAQPRFQGARCRRWHAPGAAAAGGGRWRGGRCARETATGIARLSAPCRHGSRAHRTFFHL